MLTIQDVQRVVAHIYNVSLHQIVGARASRNVTEPRLIAMWICGIILVDKSISQHRAGLTLVLQEIPNHIGAYFIESGNVIVMNKTILKAMKHLTQS